MHFDKNIPSNMESKSWEWCFCLFFFKEIKHIIWPLQSKVHSFLYCFTGLLWIECKQLYSTGLKAYVTVYQKLIDFSVLSMYLASYVLRFFTEYRIAQADRSVVKLCIIKLCTTKFDICNSWNECNKGWLININQ